MDTLPNTLDEVLSELKAIVEQSMAKNDRSGLFAYVYYRTTLQIKTEIEAGDFEDAKRMEDFDIVFANLYLKAYCDHKSNQPVSKAWQIAFNADLKNLSYIQHILLGMNAHINLDLGIAAYKVMLGKNILDLENDFVKVNDILASIVQELQMRLSRISPLLFLLDWFGGNKDEKIINFSMVKARYYAWHLAIDLCKKKGEDHQSKIQSADVFVSKLAHIIIKPPGFLIPITLQFIQWFEGKEISKTIQKIKY